MDSERIPRSTALGSASELGIERKFLAFEDSPQLATGNLQKALEKMGNK
jgi:hypothetical protein